MKILKLIVFGIVLFFAGSAQAQISVRLNLGSPPAWGPAGYDDTRYYYLPDVEAYYDVQSSMFIYSEGGNWIHRSYLPSRYRDYDLYGGYKVAMRDYRGNTPYSNFNDYRTRYARGHNREAQRTIGERPGRGNYSKKEYRNGNQANRGRDGNNGNNNKRGNNNNNRGRGNEKDNKR